ncbi:MAG: hypothetical protein AAGD38_05890 [Acidobacteriota bacterium]
MAFAEAYLTYPDLFPARHAGEPWGELSLELAFASERFRIEQLTADQAAAIREIFGEIEVTPSSHTPLRFRVYRSDPRDFVAGPWQWAYTFDLDHQADSVRLAGRGFLARFDRWPTPTASLWTATDDHGEFRGQFANVFRVVAAYRLLAADAVLVHSAAFLDAGRVVMCIGHSGDGKTTIASLAREAGLDILSDDINALSQLDDVAMVEKLPAAGDLGLLPGQPRPRPLAALCRLIKGDHNSIAPIPRSTLLGLLVTCTPFVNADPHHNQRLLDLLPHLVRDVPTFALTFRRDGGFLPVLRAAIAQTDRS